MKKYMALFRMRFISGLQYRAAAAAGIATQFFWGGMHLLMYTAFYRDYSGSFPMDFQALSSYIWLQQAFLALFMVWFTESDIFDAITSGSIAYELCRPVGLYSMWLCRSIASRASKALLRCLPILVFATLLPAPYGLAPPPSLAAALLFLPAMALGFLMVTAFCMLIYIATFFTLSPRGVHIMATSLVEFLSGGIIPLPFMPDGTRRLLELLPFASMQNAPLRIYSGDIAGTDAVGAILLQLFWVVTLTLVGISLMRVALRRVVVQGG